MDRGVDVCADVVSRDPARGRLGVIALVPAPKSRIRSSLRHLGDELATAFGPTEPVAR